MFVQSHKLRVWSNFRVQRGGMMTRWFLMNLLRRRLVVSILMSGKIVAFMMSQFKLGMLFMPWSTALFGLLTGPI